MHIALEFADAAASCIDDAALRSAVDAVANQLGFAHFALVHDVCFNADDPGFESIDTYPEAWAEEFVGQRLFLDDPVLQATTRTAKAFRWSGVADLLPIRKTHAHVLARSQRYGMGEGFTVPANVPGEPNRSCSFAVRRGRAIPETLFRLGELVGTDALHAHRRIHGFPAMRNIPHLSRRERQCVMLAVTGLSDKGIARKLGLSPETVRLYMKSARAAYGASSRTELVARALRDGTTNFLVLDRRS